MNSELSNNHIIKISNRGYFSQYNTSIYNENQEYKELDILDSVNIDSLIYKTLLIKLTEENRKLLFQYLRIKWNQIHKNLDDINLEGNDNIGFFMENNHRIFFFIEMVHQYFFPV
tara:strand:- start:634 stop:978 length:345 start_codon:yes stop_codon:yes gene_type:complete